MALTIALPYVFGPIMGALLATTLTATAATVVATGTVAAVAGSFVSTLIGTGDLGKALELGALSGAFALATLGLDQYLGLSAWIQAGVQWVESAAQTASPVVQAVVDDLAQAAGQFAAGAVRGFENSVFGSLSREVLTGSAGQGLWGQWGLGALLAGATAAVAFTAGHLIPWDQLGGPPVDTALTQKLESVDGLDGDIKGQVEAPLMAGELLLKPALEGLGEYGVASALGVKDAAALGIGAAAGAYTAPLAINGVQLSAFGGLRGVGLVGLNGADLAYVYGAGGQLTSLLGGVAGAAYDGNYGLGAYGAGQVFQYNDSVLVSKHQNKDGTYDVYLVGNGQNVTLVGTVSSYTNPDAVINSNGALPGYPLEGMTVGAFAQAAQAPGFLAQLAGPANDAPPYLAPATVNNGDAVRVPGDPDAVEWTTVGSTSYAKSDGQLVQTEGGTYTLYPSNDALNRANAMVTGAALGIASGVQAGFPPASNAGAATADVTTATGGQEAPSEVQALTDTANATATAPTDSPQGNGLSLNAWASVQPSVQAQVPETPLSNGTDSSAPEVVVSEAQGQRAAALAPATAEATVAPTVHGAPTLTLSVEPSNMAEDFSNNPHLGASAQESAAAAANAISIQQALDTGMRCSPSFGQVKWVF